MNNNVRVRFAPSPTGHLHVGGLRTALFNWLYAKHSKGVFLLRIEDTDQERSKDEYTQAIYQALKWVGIQTDEEPLIQSQRFHIYNGIAQQLIQEQKAYYCSCTPEQVEERIRAQGLVGEYHGGYDGYCRIQHGTQGAIRFVIPDLQTFSWDDGIRGLISFERTQVDDFVIVRSDGTPTYNFVVVIDDHESGITDVIRGEDHISNTPKQIALYYSLEYVVPRFSHIPMILGADGNKLSKRDGAVDVVAYRAMGYLPEALINYIARLGWAHGDQEIFTQDELINFFALEAVGKKPSVFDYTKLEWVNSFYMKKKTPEQLVSLIIASVDHDFLNKVELWSESVVYKTIALYQERSKTLVELANYVIGFYRTPSEYLQKDIEENITPSTPVLLSQILEILHTHDMQLVPDAIKQLCKTQTIPLKSIAQPIRIALTGVATSPGVFDMLLILGKQESINRLHAFIHVITR